VAVGLVTAGVEAVVGDDVFDGGVGFVGVSAVEKRRWLT
jgi:hypothetical protein